MAYMAQQWLTTAARDAYGARGDALERADEAARVRTWLGTLALDRTVVAALVEPIAALEDGLRAAANDSAAGSVPAAGEQT